MEIREILKNNFTEASDILQKFLTTEKYLTSVEEATKEILFSLQNGGKVISAGNGGSMADAMHFAEELVGKFREDRPSIPAIAISDPTYITCVANDYGYPMVFSRFLEKMGNQGDIFLAISTSGNSENIILGIIEAKKRGMKVIVLTKEARDHITLLGGKYRDFIDHLIEVPYSKYADRIQEVHIKIIHSMINVIEEKIKNF